MDSACMLFESDKDSYAKIRNSHLTNRYNNKVFITPPWKEIYRNDEERDQSFDVYERLEKWYGEYGYNIILLPKDTIENRVKFILSHVTN
jgi:predicted ATPase